MLCSVQFFPAYVKLLQSSNYVTRRQSLKVRSSCRVSLRPAVQLACVEWGLLNACTSCCMAQLYTAVMY